MELAEQLEIRPGLTAIIGSGGKTTLMYALERELSCRGRVIVTTTTHIWPPAHLEVARRAGERFPVCLGEPCSNGKLSPPEQTMEELTALADYVLVEADGSAGKPLKAHRPYEPVIPANAGQVICVVGASGLNRPVQEAVHRPELFLALTGSQIADPASVAMALKKENLFHRLVINQAEINYREARELAAQMERPAYLATLEKGEILCAF